MDCIGLQALSDSSESEIEDNAELILTENNNNNGSFIVGNNSQHRMDTSNLKLETTKEEKVNLTFNLI